MRLWIGAGLALFLAPALAVGAIGLGLSPVLGSITGAVVAVVAAGFVSGPLFLATGFALATRRWLAITAAVGTLAAGAQIFPLTLFMVDSNRVEYSTQPSDPFR